MSMNSNSYMIYGYKLHNDWLQENRRDDLEAMIGGNPKEKVWILSDDSVCYIGIPLAISDGNGAIIETSYNITDPQVLIIWKLALSQSLKEKNLLGVMVNRIAELHTFHLVK